MSGGLHFAAHLTYLLRLFAFKFVILNGTTIFVTNEVINFGEGNSYS